MSPATAEEAATSEDEEASLVHGVERLATVQTPFGTVTVAAGSVVDYTGSAIVNAANEGCIGGGGVDGAVNSRGGPSLKAARRALPIVDEEYGIRCPVGDAKTTIAGDLPCEYVIHAVGPNYGGFDDMDEADALLYSAYRSAMSEARRAGLGNVGFSLLSSGIFRGSRSLSAVLRIGLMAVAANTYPGLDEAFLVAFTQQEQKALIAAAEQLSVEPGAGLDWERALQKFGAPLRALHDSSLAQQAAAPEPAAEPDASAQEMPDADAAASAQPS